MYKGGPLPTPIPLWPVPSFRKKEMTMMLTPPSPPPSSGQGGELDPRILAGPAFALDLRTLPQASLSSSSLKEYLWTFCLCADSRVSARTPSYSPIEEQSLLPFISALLHVLPGQLQVHLQGFEATLAFPF